MQPAAFCAQLQRRDRRRIVQVNLRLAHRADGLSEDRPFIVLQVGQAQPLGIDAGLLRDQTLHELLVGHLK